MTAQSTSKTLFTEQDNRTPLQKVPVENYRNKRSVHLYSDINKRFKLTRTYLGLSSEGFAKHLGIKTSTVKAIEQERVTVNFDVLRRWHLKTGRSYDWIIDGKDKEL